MKNHFPLHAVIFDMDGVITDTMPYHYRAWHKIFHEEGIPVTKYDVYQREGQKGITSVKELFAAYRKPFSLAKAHDVLDRKERLFKKIVHIRFVPGAKSFIKKLGRNHVALALVTGTSRHEVERILPENLLERFSVIVSGNDVRHGKPHPEPYRKAVKALGASRKSIVVIENAPFGIASAKAAGLKCWAVETSLPAKYLKKADASFRNFGALTAAFHHWYGL